MSIGTLYRYFADKDEIVAVLRNRLVSELEHRFTTAVLAELSTEPHAAITSSLRGIVDALTAREALVRALSAESTLDRSGFGDLEQRLLILTRAYLLHVLGPRPDDELDTRAFVMVSVGLATSVRIALDAPLGLDREQLIAETASMLAAWLQR